MMVVSLLLWTAPAMAGNELQWDDESTPDTDDGVLLPASDISDIAVAEGGVVIYAGAGGVELYVSQDTGVTWDIAYVKVDGNDLDTDLVAVAPDDPMYIAVTGNNSFVYISDDAGATWDSLLQANSSLTVTGLDISRKSGGNHFVALIGVNGTDTEVWAYEIGAIGAGWDNIAADTGGTVLAASDFSGGIAFSPNFHSDEVLTVVAANTSASIDFHMYSFNQGGWNETGASFTDFPVAIVEDSSDADVDGLDAGAIALSPDYLGSDDDLRVAFVAITTDTSVSADEADGVFRLENDDVETLKDEKDFNSVAFDGSRLVAGEWDDTDVYRTDDPLESSPSLSGPASYKSPGGANKAMVAFAGDAVVAATKGEQGGFSVSHNDGKAFNDISLMDVALDNILDIAASPDASTIYMVTSDDTDYDVSVWRQAEDQDADWERVLVVPLAADAGAWILRLAPDDVNTIFLADQGDRDMYYSTDGGASRWRSRTFSESEGIGDLAVEGDGSTLYVYVNLGTGSYVSKSTNTGFTWGTKKTTGLTAGSNMILSLGEDLLIVGSRSGTVSYSRDGNESWIDLEDTMKTSGLVQVTAQGLDDGDFIFAATAGGGEINRWELGEDDSWDDFDSLETGKLARGIGLEGNTLYVLSASSQNSTVERFLNATKSSPTGRSIETATSVNFTSTPTALTLTGGSITLWAIDVDTATLYSLEDTVITAVPELVSPPDGFTIEVNPVSGFIPDLSLIFESPSDEITEFDLEIAYDSDFDEALLTPTIDGDTWDEGDAETYQVTGTSLIPGTTYYWRVRTDAPFRSGWASRSFKVAGAEGLPPVTVEAVPAPEITVELPAPEVTVTIPPVVQVPPAPAPITPGFIWGIIIIGALLFVSLIVLILRTRRVV